MACYWQNLEEDITDGISANIVSYSISAVPVEIAGLEINVTIMADDFNSCTNMTCKYTFEDLTEMSTLTCHSKEHSL